MSWNLEEVINQDLDLNEFRYEVNKVIDKKIKDLEDEINDEDAKEFREDNMKEVSKLVKMQECLEEETYEIFWKAFYDYLEDGGFTANEMLQMNLSHLESWECIIKKAIDILEGQV